MPLVNYAFADLITFTRSTTATFVGSNGLIQSAAIDAPRFDFDPVTLAPLGLLIEEQRVNLALYSQDASNAAWNKTRSSITADATTAPDGTLTGDKLVEDTSTTTTHRTSVSAISMTSGTSYTWTIFLKAGERTSAVIALHTGGAGNAFTTNPTIAVDLLTGALTSPSASVTASSAVLFSGGWWRVSVSATATTTTSNSPTVFLAESGTTSYTGDGTSGLFLWGGQVEAASFPTSYIPTEASTVTRAADNAAITGTDFTPWFNASEGTFVAQWKQGAVSGTRTVMAANDGTSNQSIRLRTVATDPFFTVTNGGVDQADIDAGTVAGTTVYKMAGCYRANDFATVIGGGTVVTDTSGTIPTVNQLMLGTSAASNYLNGHLRNITYYPTRLTDAQLQALTA
jgi:hypothetical protein